MLIFVVLVHHVTVHIFQALVVEALTELNFGAPRRRDVGQKDGAAQAIVPEACSRCIHT